MRRAIFVAFVAFAVAGSAHAQEQPQGQTSGVELPRSDPEAPTISAELSDGGPTLAARFGGYVETSFAWSFNEPSNGLIAWRGFDNRHATFNLENVSLSTRLEYDRVYALIAVQFGRTPDTYYLSEPSDDSGADFGVGGSSAATYRFLQEAYLGWYAPLLDDVAIEAGLFLSPVGIESIDIGSNWNWSRSNLFTGLPYYHLGLHVASALTEEVSVHAAVYNGVNNVLDNNPEKSVAVWAGFQWENIQAQLLYFGGVERDAGNWRSLFDAWIGAGITPWLKLALHVDGGFEPYGGGRNGWWLAGALYARIEPLEWLAISIRQDAFLERSPDDDPNLRIHYPTTPLVASSTLTVTLKPLEYVSLFVEYRHDHTASSSDLGGVGPDLPTYFQGDVQSDPVTSAWIPNAETQDTLTVGLEADF